MSPRIGPTRRKPSRPASCVATLRGKWSKGASDGPFQLWRGSPDPSEDYRGRFGRRDRFTCAWNLREPPLGLWRRWNGTRVKRHQANEVLDFRRELPPMIFENGVAPQAGIAERHERIEACFISRSKPLSPRFAVTISVNCPLFALAASALAKNTVHRSDDLPADSLRPMVTSADQLSSYAIDNARSRSAQIATNSPVRHGKPHPK